MKVLEFSNFDVQWQKLQQCKGQERETFWDTAFVEVTTSTLSFTKLGGGGNHIGLALASLLAWM
jgi:hypothetical protein